MKSVTVILGGIIFSLFMGSFQLQAKSPPPIMAGTYTIGGTNPDYATFTAAVSALTSQGISGAVVFDVRNGTYNEQISIDTISGASPANTITFRSESRDSSLVTLAFACTTSTDNFVLRLFGADYMRFEHLTIQATGSIYFRAVQLAQGASYNVFTHCRFSVPSASGSSFAQNVFSSFNGQSAAENDNYNTLSHNRFENGTHGLLVFGYGVNAGEREMGWQVINNVFVNSAYRAMYFHLQENCQIKGNTLECTNTTNAALYLTNCYDSVAIEQNIIDAPGANVNGIQISTSQTDTLSKIRIVNNFITAGYRGIYAFAVDRLSILHNSVVMVGNQAASMALLVDNTADCRILNNVLVNYASGYAIYLIGYLGPGFEVDYNNLYTNGNNFGRAGQLYTDFLSWQSNTAFDSHSFSLDPGFSSPPNLHTLFPALSGAASSLPDVTVDIDGENRSNPPDIGADEFSLMGSNAALVAFLHPQPPFAAGNYPLQAIIENRGSDSLVNYQMNWSLNGVSQTPILRAGPLPANQRDTILLLNQLLMGGSIYQLDGWVSLATNQTDIFPQNDSLTSSLFAPQMAGSYTLGGSSPDFADFNSVVQALQVGGIADTTTIFVRPGTYNEQFRLEAIDGVSCQTPLIFEGESGDSSDVIITFDSNFSDNYVCLIKGLSGLSFRYLTFESTDITYTRVISLEDTTDCLSWENCHLIAPSKNATGNSLIVFYYNNGYHSGIHFVKNRVENGSIGMNLTQQHFDGQYHIVGNTFINQYQGGIETLNGGTYFLAENYITTNKTYSAYQAIYLRTPRKKAIVEKNKIIQENGVGIYVISSFRPVHIQNNFVSVLGTANNEGIFLDNVDSVYLYHNNVLMKNSGVATLALWVKDARSRVKISGNIFVNEGPGRLFITESLQNLELFDNNAYYGPGNELFCLGNPILTSTFLTYGDLPAWQQASNLDSASLFVNPEFYSDSNLHVQKAALNATGKAGLGIVDDIDGELRNSPPDIGADEFMPTGMDVQLVELILPQAPFVAGTYPLSAVVRNHGTQPLSNLQIVFEVNGATPDTFAWSTSLAVGQQDTLTFANQLFNPLVRYDFKVWTQQPNGQQDVITNDDSLEKRDVWVSLAGGYTVGGTSPDLPDISTMSSVLSAAGIIDTVWFNIRTGTYTEQVTFNAYPGMSCETPVYIQSESGDKADVIWQYGSGSNNNFRARLDGVSGLVFRNLTIQTTNSYGRVIEISNGSHCNQFINNHLIGWNINNATDRFAVIYSPAGSGPKEGDTANVFMNNHIQHGSYGMIMAGYNQANPERGTRIIGNYFDNTRYRAAALNYQESIEVRDNIFETNNNSQNGRAISLYQNTGAPVIIRNKVNMPRGFGITLEDIQTAVGDTGLIANNMIYIEGTQNAKGIYIDGSRQKVLYNSVWITSTDAADGRAFELFNGQGIILKNNILVNTGTGYAIYVACNKGLESDYNDLYATGTNWGYDCGAVADLAAWQMGGRDAHSISIDPDFVSVTDLHVKATGLNRSGIPFPEVLDDIDRELRDPQNPDIGADEFTPPLRNEAALQALFVPQRPFAAGSYPLSIAIRNGGTDTLRSLRIDWEVDGVAQTSFNWSGSLPTAASDTFAFGTYQFVAGVNSQITAWLSLPNGTPDSLNVNDTLRSRDLFVALAGVYTVGGNNPDFLNFSITAENLSKGGLLDSVVFRVRDSVYHESFSLAAVAESSPANFVRYEAERGDSAQVIIRYGGAAGAVLLIDGMAHLQLRHLTFERINGTGNDLHALQLKGGINALHVHGCQFVGLPTTDNTAEKATIFLDETNHKGLYFTQNEIFYGSYGFRAETFSNSPSDSLLFWGNSFDNQALYALYVKYYNSVELVGNIVRNGVLSQANYTGLYLFQCHGKSFLEANQVLAPGGRYGIWLRTMSGPDGRVINNFVQTGGSGIGTGIYVEDLFNQKIAHNSVLYQGNSLTDGAACRVVSGNNNNFVNNIFANTGGGYAIRVDGSGSYAYTRNNDLFATGNYLGRWLTTDMADLNAWQTGTGRDIGSISVDPLFIAPHDPHVLQVQLDSAGIFASYVRTDIDGENRNAGYPDIGADEFDVFFKDLSLEAVLSPKTGCGLSSTETVTINIANPAVQAVDSFQIGYVLDSLPAVVEWVYTRIQPAQQKLISFQTTADLSRLGVHHLDVFVMLPGDQFLGNDSLRGIQLNNLPLGGAISNLLPPDSTLGLSSPLTFSWNPAANASNYDFYLWKASDPKPTQPTDSNIFATSYLYTGNLVGNEHFKWQVLPNNACAQQQASPELNFFTPLLPDLVIDTIILPLTAFSGQSITIGWSIKNIGQASTGTAFWSDEIWLSVDTVLNLFTNTFEIYLGTVGRPAALAPGQSYSQTATFSLPQTAIGPYHVFVRTAKRQVVRESIYTNNIDFSPDTIDIQLTPPPDLQVSQVIAPQTVFSGDKVNLNWTVKNEGTGPTLSGDWYDEVYLSQASFLDTRTATRLGRFRIRRNLDADSSYQQFRQITLPNGIYGVHYLHVLTDADNDEFEYVLEQNNEGSSDSMTIVLSPPIDLVVDSVWTADSVSTREMVTVFWRVKNQGAADVTSPFVDQIYLSTLPDSNLNAANKVGSLTNGVVIPAGGSLVKSRLVTMPDAPDGPYYFYVKTDDKNQVYEYVFENNNIGRTLGPVEVLAPDLQVVDFELPDSAVSNQNTSIGWTLFNAGPGKVYNRSWKDEVMISRHPVFDPDSTALLGRVNRYGLIQKGDSLAWQQAFRLPNGLSGDYYVYVRTDYGSAIFEGQGETNNLARSVGTIYIDLPQWPDLQLVQKQLPASIMAGDSLQMQFEVKNAGQGDIFGKRWTDKLYVQLDTLFNAKDAYLLKTASRAISLAADSSYIFTYDAAFPRIHQLKGGQGLDSAQLYLFFQIDATNAIYEHTGEADNLWRSDSIFVKEAERPDLVLSAATFGPDSLWSGQQTSIHWTVENAGKSTRFWKTNSWLDHVYLSADSSFDASQDVQLVSRGNLKALDKGESYSQVRTFTVPNGISGDYYLFLLADALQAVPEGQRANNLALLRKANGAARSIHIRLSPSPDLAIKSLQNPLTGTAGQPVDILWTVKNEGAAATTGTGWIDRFYLSGDSIWDSSDLLIGGKTHLGNLQPGQSYSDSVSLNLPTSAQGNYYLMARVDYRDDVYEHQAEANNQALRLITVDQPLPIDLVVTQVLAPDSAFLGEELTIEWDVLNQGMNPANAFMTEAVYLSADTLWDPGDALLGTIRRQLNLPSQATTRRSLTALLKISSLQDYHVIVRTDITNRFVELDETNNTGFRQELMGLRAHELPLGIWQRDTLADRSELYYRIHIPDSLVGEDMLVELLGDANIGQAELYLRYADLPSQAVQDYASLTPYVNRQEIIISSVQKGDYYLMGFADNMGRSSQPIELRAMILPFEVREVDAKQGGNTGSVTIRIKGSQFQSYTDFALQDSGRTLLASQVYYLSRVEVFATFNLRGAALGDYDVVAINSPGDSARLVDGFAVVTGSLGAGLGQGGSVGSGTGGLGAAGITCSIQNVGMNKNLKVWITGPGQVRDRRQVAITIHFRNEGNVDLPVLNRPFISIGGAPLAHTAPELKLDLQQILIEMKEDGGPPGVLRPGAQGTITVYSLGIRELDFVLLL